MILIQIEQENIILWIQDTQIYLVSELHIMVKYII